MGAKDLIWKYLDKLLDEFLENLKYYKPIPQLADEYNLSGDKIKIILKTYEGRNYHSEYYPEIFKLLYTRVSIKKIDLILLIANQIKKFYPKNIEKISSIYSLKKFFKTDHPQKWIFSYLKIKFGVENVRRVYDEIWSYRDWKNKELSYQDIVNTISEKEAEVLTSEMEFNLMKKPPTKRNIHIKDKYGHEWYPLVNDIRIRNQWCPICHEGLCKKVTRLFMEAIFKVPFKKSTLKKAHETTRRKGGYLEYDGFNKKVELGGKYYRIAFEFGGIQHDMFPNHIHKNIQDFRLRKWRDAMKDLRAKQNNTILIRIKQINGYNRDTLNKIPFEIVKLFKKSTNLAINIPILTFDNKSKKVIRVI
jgi:hypothetical protein